MLRTLTTLLILASTPAVHAQHKHNHAHGKHVHGVATMDIAIDGNTISIALESPLDSVLGFEHAPRTDKEKQAAARLRDTLNAPTKLFAPTPEAQCTPSASKFDLSALEPPAAGAKASEHADLDAEWTFTCAQPALLKRIELKPFFAAFPHMRQLTTQLVSPKGQKSAKLSAKIHSIAW